MSVHILVFARTARTNAGYKYLVPASLDPMPTEGWLASLAEAVMHARDPEREEAQRIITDHALAAGRRVRQELATGSNRPGDDLVVLACETRRLPDKVRETLLARLQAYLLELDRVLEVRVDWAHAPLVVPMAELDAWLDDLPDVPSPLRASVAPPRLRSVSWLALSALLGVAVAGCGAFAVHRYFSAEPVPDVMKRRENAEPPPEREEVAKRLAAACAAPGSDASAAVAKATAVLSNVSPQRLDMLSAHDATPEAVTSLLGAASAARVQEILPKSLSWSESCVLRRNLAQVGQDLLQYQHESVSHIEGPFGKFLEQVQQRLAAQDAAALDRQPNDVQLPFFDEQDDEILGIISGTIVPALAGLDSLEAKTSVLSATNWASKLAVLKKSAPKIEDTLSNERRHLLRSGQQVAYMLNITETILSQLSGQNVFLVK